MVAVDWGAKSATGAPVRRLGARVARVASELAQLDGGLRGAHPTGAVEIRPVRGASDAVLCCVCAMSSPVRTASLSSLRSVGRPKTRSDSSSTTGLEMPQPVPKSVLSHVGRLALSDVNSTPHCCTRAPGGKLQSAELRVSSVRRAVSSDGVEPRGAVAVHSAAASTCLNQPEGALPVLSSVAEGPSPVGLLCSLAEPCTFTRCPASCAASGPSLLQSPDKKALPHMSVEAMQLPLDCSGDSYVFPEEDSLGVMVDGGSDSSSSLPPAPGAEDFSQGLPGLSGGPHPAEPLCSTPDWRELPPEVAVSDLELADEEDAANVSDMEGMHLNDDDEHLFDIPDEFRLDDKHLAILGDVCGVAWHQKHEAAPAGPPSAAPEFALPRLPIADDHLLMEEYMDLESLDKKIGEPLQLVPLE
ncbi:uncharacterized protein LOC144151528 isoform X2 [Haemaphysalis longicornis]